MVVGNGLLSVKHFRCRSSISKLRGFELDAGRHLGRHGRHLGRHGGVTVPKDGVRHHQGNWGGRGVGGGEGGGGVVRVIVGRVRVQALLLLPPVAEPDPHHLLLHVQRLRDERHFLACRLWVLIESSLQSDPDRCVDRSPLLPPFVDRVLLCWREKMVRQEVRLLLLTAVVQVRVLQPLGQQRLQLAHVLEGEVERLKPRDGRLGEVVAVQLAHGQADVALGVAELDPLLLEHLGKLLQLLQVCGLLRGQLHTVHAALNQLL